MLLICFVSCYLLHFLCTNVCEGKKLINLNLNLNILLRHETFVFEIKTSPFFLGGRGHSAFFQMINIYIKKKILFINHNNLN